MSISIIPLCLFFAVASLHAAPGFWQKPACQKDSAGVRISFAASPGTDCAVWIEDAKGKTVRHLAAGLLGKEAPPPLIRDKNIQSLLWDGRDDAGSPLPGGKYTVRVGLGLAAAMNRVIGPDKQWMGGVHGLAVNPAGELYAYSDGGIKVLDRSGKILRQIAPAPSTLPPARLQGLRSVRLADGSDYFQEKYRFPGSLCSQMALTPSGRLLLPGPGRYPRSLTVINTDGSVGPDAFDRQLTRFSDVGYLALACSPDGKILYFTGAEAGYMGDDAREACYRQAVYRLKLDDVGPAEIFLGDDENIGDEGFFTGFPKGLCTDKAGNLYVCNYSRDWENGKTGGIAIFSPGGAFLNSIPVPYPQLVAVNPKSGHLYVLTGREEAVERYGFKYPAMLREARLVRINPAGKEEFSLKIEDPFIKQRKDSSYPEYRVCMAVDFSTDKPLVWLGLSEPNPRFAKWSLLRIEDEGARFGKPADVCPRKEDRLPDPPVKICLDRATDILYVVDEFKRLLRFKGDGTVLSSLKFTGEEEGKPFTHMIGEAAVDNRGNLVILGYREYGYSDTYVLRFSPEGKPLPFSAADGRSGIAVKNGLKGSTGARGLTVAPDGKIYVIHYDLQLPDSLKPAEAWDRGYNLVEAVSQFDSSGKLLNPRFIAHLRAGGMGVRADKSGNVFVADNFMPVGTAYPFDFSRALPDPLKRPFPAMMPDGRLDPLLYLMGSVFKFGPAGGLISGLPEDDKTGPAKRPPGDLWKPAPETQWFVFNNHRLKVKGVAWQYHGISPIPAQYHGVTHVDRCVCRGARFDLDEFGRVYVPDALRRRVTVLDNEGNTLLSFGLRGNADETEGKIALDEPVAVAAAGDRVYVADRGLRRILRVALSYRAEASCEIEK